MSVPSPLVSTDWLAEHLGDEVVKVLDASWHLPTANRDPRAEYEAAHIPGAQFYDIDGIATPNTGLPHMAASPVLFAELVGALGISVNDTIVVYDSVGLFSAARAWWNFRIMGAANVFVLDGGLPKWRAEGLPVVSGVVSAATAKFIPSPAPGAVASAEDVLGLLKDGSAQVVDVRPAGRFRGEAPEPRPGLRSGHMPGALNLPSGELVANGRLAEPDVLRQRLAGAGVDINRPVVTSCGSGVTAPLVNLALARLGIDALSVYDGSWAEWGGRDDLPVVNGD